MGADYQRAGIGSIRRECLDHFIILGEAHLRRILGAYTGSHTRFQPPADIACWAPNPFLSTRVSCYDTESGSCSVEPSTRQRRTTNGQF